MGALGSLGTACERYGPGRLPMADRRDVGAGYAGASAALVAALLFALFARGMDALGSPIGSDWEFLAVMAVIAIPFVVPAAFVSAAVTWRVVPDTLPYLGAIGGIVATVGAYLVALAVLLVVSTGLAASSSSSAPVAEAVVFTAFVGFVAFTTTCWLTIPIGCVGGVVYEPASRDSA